MKLSYYFLVLALAISAVWLIAIRSARAKQTAYSTLVTLTTRHAELTVQLHRWELDLAATKAEQEAASSPNASLLPAAPAIVEPLAQPPPASSWTEWMKDPKVQQLYFAKTRAELPLSYEPFFQIQKLTPVQRDKLVDVIINDFALREDLRAIRQERNLSLSDPSLVALREQQATALRDAQIELLGDEGYAKLKDYERALPVRQFIARVAGGAALAGVPVSREHAEQLTTIIALADAQYAAGGPVKFDKIDWAIAEPQAKLILSSAQFNLFRTPPAGKGRSPSHVQLNHAVHRAIHIIEGAKSKAAP